MRAVGAFGRLLLASFVLASAIGAGPAPAEEPAATAAPEAAVPGGPATAAPEAGPGAAVSPPSTRPGQAPAAPEPSAPGASPAPRAREGGMNFSEEVAGRRKLNMAAVSHRQGIKICRHPGSVPAP